MCIFRIFSSESVIHTCMGGPLHFCHEANFPFQGVWMSPGFLCCIAGVSCVLQEYRHSEIICICLQLHNRSSRAQCVFCSLRFRKSQFELGLFTNFPFQGIWMSSGCSCCVAGVACVPQEYRRAKIICICLRLPNRFSSC